MSLVLVVRMRVAEGNEERLAQVLDELARASRDEPGCELYIPSRSTDDARSYQIYEQYRDRDALEAHGASEHFQRLAVGVMLGLLEGERERMFYETIVD